MVIIGIDLGNTKTCAAFYTKGRVEIIPNEHGDKTTPSYVSFTRNERLIGKSAKNQAALNIGNTVFGVKRLMGLEYDYLNEIIRDQYLPFKLINDDGKPKVIVKYKGKRKHFAFEEITAMILCKVKQLAESFLGAQIDSAVLTVPAYFNSSQRQATKDAGSIAGLNVVKILNEPTAAGLAYGVTKSVKNKNIVVFDFGGGTLDVSVLTIGESKYEVKSSSGIACLGGEDFDNRLVEFFIDDFRGRFRVDVSSEGRVRMRLKAAAERAKKVLTMSTEAVVHVESICSGIDYKVKITRSLFEDLCSDLFLSSLTPVTNSLSAAGITENDIDEVVLIGGSTRIPKIQTLLRDFFAKPVTSAINPDEAVAYGAAVGAALYSGSQMFIHNFVLIDILPLSLGIETLQGVMCKVVERNTPIPCRVTKELTMLGEFQNEMIIEVFEGERSLTKYNNLLGVFKLNNISPVPSGVSKLDITFDIDSNGIVTVTVRDRVSGESQDMVLRNEKRLNQRDMERMIADAERYKEEDKEQKRCIEARNQLESYICDMKQMVIDNPCKLSAEERAATLNQCEEELAWIDIDSERICEDFQLKLTELMGKWSLVMMRINDDSILRRALMQNIQEQEPAELPMIVEFDMARTYKRKTNRQELDLEVNVKRKTKEKTQENGVTDKNVRE